MDPQGATLRAKDKCRSQQPWCFSYRNSDRLQVYGVLYRYYSTLQFGMHPPKPKNLKGMELGFEN